MLDWWEKLKCIFEVVGQLLAINININMLSYNASSLIRIKS